MQKITITVLAMLMPSISAAAPEQSKMVPIDKLPSEVGSFVILRSQCEDYAAKTAAATGKGGNLPHLYVNCEGLATNENVLRLKYRLNANVIQALDGKWTRIVRRLQFRQLPDNVPPR